MAAATDLVRLTQPGTDARQLAGAESRVVAWVADLMPREDATPPAGIPALARATDLEVWIEAHLDEPLLAGMALRGCRCWRVLPTKQFDAAVRFSDSDPAGAQAHSRVAGLTTNQGWL